MDWKSQRIIAFDTETTGLTAHDGDRVIEFAAVEIVLDQSGAVIKTNKHEMFVNPGIPIPSEIVKLTGIDDDTVAKAPPFDRIADKVAKLLEGSICIAHNFAFDQIFIAMEFDRLGRHWPNTLAEIDTLDLSIRYFPNERGHKLALFCDRLGVTLDGAHRAANDAEATGRAFAALAKQLNAPSDLDQMLEWSAGLGRPPTSHWIHRNKLGALIFSTGELKDQLIEHHPSHLQWMLIAKEHTPEGWREVYPESLRRWISQFLKCRSSGRTKPPIKSFGPADWTIDSNSLPIEIPS